MKALGKARNLGCMALVVAAMAPCQATASTLLTNGAFESGVLSPWAIIYPTAPDAVGNAPATVIDISSQPVDVHSGSYGVGVRNPGWTSQAGGIIGVLGMIAQSFDTVPGQSYALSYWLKILDSPGTADLGVAGWGDANAGCNWAVVIPNNQSGPPCGVVSGSWIADPSGRDWVQYSFTVTATSLRSTLVLGGRSDFSRVSFDDVSLTPIAAVPEPASLLLLLAAGVAGLAARRRRGG